MRARAARRALGWFAGLAVVLLALTLDALGFAVFSLDQCLVELGGAPTDGGTIHTLVCGTDSSILSGSALAFAIVAVGSVSVTLRVWRTPTRWPARVAAGVLLLAAPALTYLLLWALPG